MRLTIFGTILLIAGLAIFANALLHLLSGTALDDQAKVPGTLVEKIETGGRYFVWDNYSTLFEGERIKYPGDCPPDAQVLITNEAGTELPFVMDSSQEWNIGNSGKKSVGYVDVDAATQLTISVNGVGRERVFSVSKDALRQELWKRLSGFVIGVTCAILGLATASLGLLAKWRRAGSAPPTVKSTAG